MPEPEDVPHPPSPAAHRSRRSGDSLAWEPDRPRRASAKTPPDRPEVGEPGGPSQRPGDLPASLARRYFTETLRGGLALACFEGPGARRAAFTDHGARLVADQTNPAVVRDLAAIAAHRGWSRVRVTGSDAFRREMWMQARALGLEVKGYRSTERDQQELERGGAASNSAAQRSMSKSDRPHRTGEHGASGASPRVSPDYAQGVAGVLLESGRAPYRRRAGEPVTPFIRIDRGEGQLLDIWGVGLPEALARSGAQTGDPIHVRRDGVDLVRRPVERRDDQTSGPRAKVHEVSRNRWIIVAERFRQASPSEAARDEDLVGAQSHLRILSSVIDGAVRDPERRERLHAEARALVADELARGKRFEPARLREIEPGLARDLAEAAARDASRARVQQR